MIRQDALLHDFDPGLARYAESVDPAAFSTLLEEIRADAAAYRADAIETLIPARNLEQVMAEVLRDALGPRYSARDIPLGDFGVNPWTDRFIQRRLSRLGMLMYVTSADMPTGDVAAQEITHKLYTLGGKAEMSWFEQQSAGYAGIDVMGEKLMERREAAEDTQDTILINGDASIANGGFIRYGLVNHPEVPVASVPNGDWSNVATTPDEIIEDVLFLVRLHRTQSRRLEPADTLRIPEAQYSALERPRSSTSDKTIRQWLLENIPELTSIEALPELATAGASGVPRALLYTKSDRVLRGVVPLGFSFIAEEVSKLRTYVWGILRMVGLIVRRPFAMVYSDNV
jgi:Uncharacterized protein conserved in bacteria